MSKTYSCYTPAHEAYIRLDLVLLTNDGSLTVRRAEYLVRFLSDYAPLVLECETNAPRPAIPLWSLPPKILRDPEYRLDVLAALQGYIRENWITARTRGMEWKALKVVVRGVSTVKVYGVRRKLEEELTQQEGALELLQSREGDGAVDAPGLLEVHKRIEVVWNRLDNLVHRDYRDYRQRLHREGDQLGWMLAWLLNHERPTPVVLFLCGPAGDMIVGLEWINCLLHDHLRGVHVSPLRVDDT
ncbi:hypothetical protein NDU88_005866 [Pleurodeles waltl]|uniref:Uncharacterized protein n=1 Tax=Pleurodeles waltl TaxID=8319 RepID=A0AAV7NRL7_PLEWA|nr:hypothetical protein NDU88_005866 [Pleurodeles waltl]